MRGLERSLAAVAAAACGAAALSGCTLNAAPDGWLPKAHEVSIRGGWIELEGARATPAAPIEGEFLAVDAESVWVLTASEVVAMPLREVVKGKLTGYDPKAGRLGTWSLLGALATPSHGGGALISLPLWILVGTIATHEQAESARRETPERSWAELSAYARFPQGPPTGVNLHLLKPLPR